MLAQPDLLTVPAATPPAREAARAKVAALRRIIDASILPPAVKRCAWPWHPYRTFLDDLAAGQVPQDQLDRIREELLIYEHLTRLEIEPLYDLFTAGQALKRLDAAELQHQQT